jgi:hypothetical protein
MKLFESCVYTIRLQSGLVAAANGRQALLERKPWVTAAKMHRLAKKRGEVLGVVFADAGDVSELVAWSYLTRVTVTGKTTRYEIGPLWRITGKTPHDLTRVSKHQRIKRGFIWPYVLCETPQFLHRAAKAPKPWVYREMGPRSDSEGKRRLVTHLSRERSTALRNALKSAHMIRNAGHLPCEICGFDFMAVYGDVGTGFAEAHHIVPLAEAPRHGRAVTVEDFIVVCSNCHRMLHRGPDYPSINALRRRLRENR